MDPLPAVDLSAYRIVQEALTNVLRHSGPARIQVDISHRADGIHLSIVDDGGRPVPLTSPAELDSSRHGLVGIRERVAVFGGDLAAGRRPEGGFAVHARLPALTTATT